MLKKLICLFWGHKFIVKAATGNTFDTKDRLTGEPIKGHYYKYERKDYCLRCGANLIHGNNIN